MGEVPLSLSYLERKTVVAAVTHFSRDGHASFDNVLKFIRSFGSDMDVRCALARGGKSISSNNEARAFFNGTTYSLDVIPTLIVSVLGLPETEMRWALVSQKIREQLARQSIVRIDLAPASAPSALAIVPVQQAECQTLSDMSRDELLKLAHKQQHDISKLQAQVAKLRRNVSTKRKARYRASE
eukprot:6821867-Pyramimonas_sp.AAC.1